MPFQIYIWSLTLVSIMGWTRPNLQISTPLNNEKLCCNTAPYGARAAFWTLIQFTYVLGFLTRYSLQSLGPKQIPKAGNLSFHSPGLVGTFLWIWSKSTVLLWVGGLIKSNLVYLDEKIFRTWTLIQPVGITEIKINKPSCTCFHIKTINFTWFCFKL